MYFTSCVGNLSQYPIETKYICACSKVKLIDSLTGANFPGKCPELRILKPDEILICHLVQLHLCMSRMSLLSQKDQDHYYNYYGNYSTEMNLFKI